MTPNPSLTTSSMCQQRLDQAFAEAAARAMPAMPKAPTSSSVESGTLAEALATPFTCLPASSAVHGTAVISPFGDVGTELGAHGGAHPHHVAPAFALPDPLQSAFAHIPEHVKLAPLPDARKRTASLGASPLRAA
eukprot:7507979-Karenia_brevis.AAC.1